MGNMCVPLRGGPFGRQRYEPARTGSYQDVDPSTRPTPQLKLKSKKLEDQPYFHGRIEREEVCEILKNQGEFLVRESINTRAEQPLVLTVFWDGRDRHFPISQDVEQMKWRLGNRTFSTVPELILYYHKQQKAISGPNVRLITPVVRDKFQLSHKEITLLQQIGSGNFGTVWKAKYDPFPTDGARNSKEGRKEGGKIVAVKVCKDGEQVSTDEKKRFLREARRMKRFQHENVLGLIGICVLEDPIMIVTEFMAGGGLDDYLKNNKGNILIAEMCRFCLDAASGMDYIAGKKLIHRDLAARNCLLDEGKTLKIADFGLSREGDNYRIDPSKAPSTTPSTISVSENVKARGAKKSEAAGPSSKMSRESSTQLPDFGNRRLPLRWLAPEAFSKGFFSTKSDVWSFGILMFEIFTELGVPFAEMDNNEVRNALLAHSIQLAPPENMPEELQGLMKACMNIEPGERPDFAEIRVKIAEVISRSSLITQTGIDPTLLAVTQPCEK